MCCVYRAPEFHGPYITDLIYLKAREESAKGNAVSGRHFISNTSEHDGCQRSLNRQFMGFGYQLVYCLIVDRGADVVGIPIKDDLTKGDTDWDDMYETSQQGNDSVLANSYFSWFVQPFAGDVTERSASM